MRRFGLLARAWLFATALAATFVPLSALADCLTGVGAVGMETGNQVLAVSPTNLPAEQLNVGAVCGPNWGKVEPGVFNNSSGRAEFATDSGGYAANAMIIAGPDVSGIARATVSGSTRYAFRIESQPGYTGPSPIDVDIDIYFFATGDGSASGLGSSFGGTYTSDGSIKEAGGIGTYLYHASGATSTASPILYNVTHSMKVDTDYIVTFPITIQVQALSAYDANTGTNGSASSGGRVLLSWQVAIDSAFQDPDLAVEFEMVSGALGLDPPQIGGAPPLPSELAVPLAGAAALSLLALGVGAIGFGFARAGPDRAPLSRSA